MRSGRISGVQSPSLTAAIFRCRACHVLAHEVEFEVPLLIIVRAVYDERIGARLQHLGEEQTAPRSRLVLGQQRAAFRGQRVI
jgi:hypothetical protein